MQSSSMNVAPALTGFPIAGAATAAFTFITTYLRNITTGTSGMSDIPKVEFLSIMAGIFIPLSVILHIFTFAILKENIFIL